MKAIDKGLLKTFSKMGISTLQSYQGAQIFEAIGLSRSLVEKYFTGTSSRIEGIGMEVLAREALMKHQFAMQPPMNLIRNSNRWRISIPRARRAPSVEIQRRSASCSMRCGSRNSRPFREFADIVNQQNRDLQMLRGMFEFKPSGPAVPLKEVEPASEIVKRFATGAMSFGSISKEGARNLGNCHEPHRRKSNTGEGGEDEARYIPDSMAICAAARSSRWRRRALALTTNYMINADDLQIKIAQGAKPGEGGQLPGHKVDDVIARVRPFDSWSRADFSASAPRYLFD